MRHANLLAAAAALTGAMWAAPASAWDMFPTLPPAAHYAGGEGFEFRPGIQECLKDLSERHDANYYAAIVNNTSLLGDPGDNDAVPYVDALTGHWGQRLRPDKDVVMVMGIQNRAVAIHPGSQWVRLGFETYEIKRTIDNSTFKNFARSGDYDGGVCALAEAVQQRLDALAADLERLVESSRSDLASARSKFIALAEQVTSVKDREVREILQERADHVQNTLDELSFAVSQRNGAQMRSLQSELVGAVASLESGLGQLERQAPLDEAFRTEVERAIAEWNTSPLSPERKDALVERGNACVPLLPSLEDAVRDGYDDTLARRCLEDARWAFDNNMSKYRLTHQVLPAGLLLLFGALGAIGAALFAHRRKASKALAQRQIEAWSEKLGNAGERLLQLENDGAMYLSSAKIRYEGQTAELDRKCADAVNLLFLIYEQADTLHRRARTAFDAAPFFEKAVFDRCVEWLTTTPVRFDTGIPETKLRVFMPLTRAYEGNALKLLTDLEVQYVEATGLLRKLLDAIDGASRLGAAVDAAVGSAVEAMSWRSSHGFSVQSYEAALAAIDNDLKRLSTQVYNDPVAANTSGLGLLQQTEALAARLETGNQALRRLVDDVTPLAQAERARVRELRATGWKLQEAGFDPDVLLDHANLLAREVRAKLAAFDDEGAEALSQELERQVTLVRAQIDVSVDARSSIPNHVAELQARIQEIHAEIPAAKKTLQRLHAEFAVSSFEVESDNIDELAQILADLKTWLGGVTASHAMEAYLAAVADAEVSRSMVEACGRLIQELHDAHERLSHMRDQARQIKDRCMELARSLRNEMAGVGVGAARRRAIETALNVYDVAVGLVGAERPDWRQALAHTQSAHARLSVALEDARAGQAAARRAGEAFVAHKRALELTLADARAERRDRPKVEYLLEEVSGELNDYQSFLNDTEQAGEALEEMAREFGDRVATAKGLWESERQIIHDATAELSRADQRLREVQATPYSYGVTVSLHNAKLTLGKAEAAAQKLNWEDVLKLSRRAITEINTEHKAAKRRVQAEQDARRAAAAAASWASSSSSSSSSWSSSSSSSSWSSSGSSYSSSSSSFSSSSSWSSSSSGGSSYSGSSSGGSSW